ncbi:PREDICTED: uncharacterized protein LOC104607645 [Nelumbo nucifera]|uniref:Uncharacterized protein LOC104607645 n=2 Tax=Nelumbo nucifera TaxID=4432 RepID=A0A1U8B6U5_NELNU|nr:PREDICTED: uncharacterized protein LOC104607645 [Nelumbo nucifera]DAD28867.1 TPA_asm: hypothetical protein HUJ06_030335 [Nelumbo nucifera]
MGMKEIGWLALLLFYLLCLSSSSSLRDIACVQEYFAGDKGINETMSKRAEPACYTLVSRRGGGGHGAHDYHGAVEGGNSGGSGRGGGNLNDERSKFPLIVIAGSTAANHHRNSNGNAGTDKSSYPMLTMLVAAFLSSFVL